MRTKLFIFIAGGSGSGKTTLASKLHIQLENSGLSVSMISMDNFYKEVPPNQDVMTFRLNTDFCDLSSIDLPYLTTTLENLKKGKPTNSPIYNFITSRRNEKEEPIPPCSVVIIEGMFAINFANTLLDWPSSQQYRIFVGGDSYLNMPRQRAIRDLKPSQESGRGLDILQIRKQELGLRNGFFKHLCKQQLVENRTVYFSNNPNQDNTVKDKLVSELADNILERIIVSKGPNSKL